MKGAPEAVLSRCSRIADAGIVRQLTEEDKKAIMEKADSMASRALRVLAFSGRPMSLDEPLFLSEVESKHIFSGLAGMMDPPRKEVMQAISLSKEAGIRTVMIPATTALPPGL
jgi:Ca2+-transporting ATPase